jgi:hypothetical protein
MDAPRFAAGVMGSFAGAAMLLAGIGLLRRAVLQRAQRTRELAVRSALGAGARSRAPGARRRPARRRARRRRGLLGAAAFAQIMRGVLFGVTPLDTVAFLAAPLGLAADVGAGLPRPALRRAAADLPTHYARRIERACP